MTNAAPEIEALITPTLIAESGRLDLLAKFFGPALMIRGENLVYAHMGRLAPAYNGGGWDFYTLSNGGFYMAPKAESFEVSTALNTTTMSGDAAGVVATMFAIGQLLGSGVKCSKLRDSYYFLRDYAFDHAESSLIIQAID